MGSMSVCVSELNMHSMSSSVSFPLQTEDLDSNETIQKCFDRFVESREDGLNFKTFALLLEAIFVNKRKIPYYIPMQWKTELFRLFDTNNDKIISFEEFKLMWNRWIKIVLQPKSALIIVDVQNDFISGTLAINKCPAGHNGEDVIPVINQLIDSVPFDLIVYSLDWHPSDHISFYENLEKRSFKPINNYSLIEPKIVTENKIEVYDTVVFEGPPQTEQKLWPTHCVQNSWGSQLHDGLKKSDNSIVVYKGTKSNIDSYSAFWDNKKLTQTKLKDELEKSGITDVYICGIAYDVCVGWTAMHAIEFGYRTVIIDDATRGLYTDHINEMKSKLIENKAIIVDSNKVLNMVKSLDRRPELGYAFVLNN